MLCYGGDMRALMLFAHDLGMLNGDYAFLTVNLLPSAAIGNNTFMGNDGRDAEAALAFRGILSIHVREPTTDLWRLFTKNVRQKMNDYPFHIQLEDQEKVILDSEEGNGRSLNLGTRGRDPVSTKKFRPLEEIGTSVSHSGYPLYAYSATVVELERMPTIKPEPGQECIPALT